MNRTLFHGIALLLIISGAYLAYGRLSVRTATDNPAPTGIIGKPDTTGAVTATGSIRKERIPPDLQLGEFWYWIYFSEPFLLEENATGGPQEVDKLQVNPPLNMSETDFGTFLYKTVEVNGILTWGYAESRVIQIGSVRVISE